MKSPLPRKLVSSLLKKQPKQDETPKLPNPPLFQNPMERLGLLSLRDVETAFLILQGGKPDLPENNPLSTLQLQDWEMLSRILASLMVQRANNSLH